MTAASMTSLATISPVASSRTAFIRMSSRPSGSDTRMVSRLPEAMVRRSSAISLRERARRADS